MEEMEEEEEGLWMMCVCAQTNAGDDRKSSSISIGLVVCESQIDDCVHMYVHVCTNPKLQVHACFMKQHSLASSSSDRYTYIYNIHIHNLPALILQTGCAAGSG